MRYLFLSFVFAACAASAWDNLDYGIPGACDQIVEREGYALGYSRRHGQPLWVSYRLTADEATNRVAKYSAQFYYDPDIRTGTAMPKDYAKAKYVRGHLAPVADMRFSTNVLRQSFSMANVSPQWPGFNLGVWKRLEKEVRDAAVREGAVFIVTGPVFSTNAIATVANGVIVPEGFYKVVLVEKTPMRMAGYLVPNESSARKPSKFAVSVDEIEAKTGLDFFHTMSYELQTNLESRVETLDQVKGP